MTMNKATKLAMACVLCGIGAAAHAYEQGDWVLRAGATTVDPNTKSDDIPLPGGLVARAHVDNDTELGILPVYMVTDTVAIEVLAATPFQRTIEAQGQGAIGGTHLDAGSTKHLPPTVSVQWYPRGGQSGWQPYLGAGINYTMFFDTKADGQLVALLGDLTGGAVNDADLELDDSTGFALQAGVDIPIAERWAFNVGVWYIDLDTTAEITAKADGATAAKVKFDVQLDPWVYNIGIAYRF